jgi:hypothetical protein
MKTQTTRERLSRLLKAIDSKSALNEDGAVLIVALLLIAILSLIGISASRNVVTDTAIASNHLASVQSFYVAEAGIERAKNECARRYITGGWTNFNEILRGADGTGGTSDDGILTFGSNVSFHGGAYAARVVNDYGDTGGLSTDTNDTVTIISTGTYGIATTQLRTTIKMNSIPALPGAVNLVGGYATSFTGNSFNVDGRDYKIGDAENSPTGTHAAVEGISLNDVPNLAAGVSAIDATLASTQQNNVKGSGGTPSVGSSTLLSKTIMREFADSMKMSADTLLTNPPDITGSTDANNCVMVGTQNTCLGTLAAPKLTYISVTDGNAFETRGNITGVGILIIDGNSLVFKGDVNWTGIVMVLGQNIGFDDMGGGHTQNIRGGLLVGEYADTNSSLDLLLKGNPKLLYSQEAIDKVTQYLVNKKKYSVISWQRVY